MATTVVQKVIKTVLKVGQGPAGPAGIGTGFYNHTQASASAEWVINHNLGYRPSVRPMTVGGVELVGEVSHFSLNQARVVFDTPLAGIAVCS